MSEPFNSVRRFSQLTWNCDYIDTFSSNSKLSCWWKKQFLYTKSKLLLNKTVCTLLEWLLVPSYFVLAFCVIISAFAKWSGMQEKAQNMPQAASTIEGYGWITFNLNAFNGCVIFFVLTASQQRWAELFTSTFSAQLTCYVDLSCAWFLQVYL